MTFTDIKWSEIDWSEICAGLIGLGVLIRGITGHMREKANDMVQETNRMVFKILTILEVDHASKRMA